MLSFDEDPSGLLWTQCKTTYVFEIMVIREISLNRFLESDVYDVIAQLLIYQRSIEQY